MKLIASSAEYLSEIHCNLGFKRLKKVGAIQRTNVYMLTGLISDHYTILKRKNAKMKHQIILLIILVHENLQNKQTPNDFLIDFSWLSLKRFLFPDALPRPPQIKSQLC